MASAKKASKSNGSSAKPARPRKSKPALVVCLRNEGCDDLDLRRVYRLLPDDTAAAQGYLRVVDESGEDYLYPADYFAPIQLPDLVVKALLQTA
jgi:hypothetical protein